MVLERHGIFTFGDTAKESYERMIDAVTLAERFSVDKMGTASVPAVYLDDALEARVASVVRGALATASGEPPEHAPIVAVRSNCLPPFSLKSASNTTFSHGPGQLEDGVIGKVWAVSEKNANR